MEAVDMERRNFREKNVGSGIDRVYDYWDKKNEAGKGRNYQKIDFLKDIQKFDVILTFITWASNPEAPILKSLLLLHGLYYNLSPNISVVKNL